MPQPTAPPRTPLHVLYPTYICLVPARTYPSSASTRPLRARLTKMDASFKDTPLNSLAPVFWALARLPATEVWICRIRRRRTEIWAVTFGCHMHFEQKHAQQHKECLLNPPTTTHNLVSPLLQILFFWILTFSGLLRGVRWFETRRFGITYRSHFQGSRCPFWTSWLLMMGLVGGLETLISNHLTPRNNLEDGRIQLNRGGSLRSRKFYSTLRMSINSVSVHSDSKLSRNVFFRAWRQAVGKAAR
jgi:hypothetical protein